MQHLIEGIEALEVKNVEGWKDGTWKDGTWKHTRKKGLLNLEVVTPGSPRPNKEWSLG